MFRTAKMPAQSGCALSCRCETVFTVSVLDGFGQTVVDIRSHFLSAGEGNTKLSWNAIHVCSSTPSTVVAHLANSRSISAIVVEKIRITLKHKSAFLFSVRRQTKLHQVKRGVCSRSRRSSVAINHAILPSHFAAVPTNRIFHWAAVSSFQYSKVTVNVQGARIKTTPYENVYISATGVDFSRNLQVFAQEDSGHIFSKFR